MILNHFLRKKSKESEKSKRKSKKGKIKEEPKVKPDLDGIVVFSDSDDENDICSLNKQVASIVKSK